MANAVKSPQNTYLGMDITVGALQYEEKKEVKKGMKLAEGLSLGDTEFFHGIFPQWKLLEDKYFEKWEKNQEKYKTRLKEITERRLRRKEEKFQLAHNMILCLAGPEWYQELSPQQKEVIDNLKTVIKKDLDGHLTKATQSSLSRLGMRPLPNDRQLWKALTKSFGCPVEFLMVLYQLIKPDNKFYSINDRLLLSAVVHLCLRDTLREMHVRSPSPPKVKQKLALSTPKLKKKKYRSVYLIPFTFEWPQRKPDIYKNPMVQRPTSPYFSYIFDYENVSLRICDDLTQDDRIDENVKIPCEMFEDHLVAEDYYNLQFKRSDSKKYVLLRPTMYKSSTPQIYPGVLPKYMLMKKYQPSIDLFFDVKIYDEIDPRIGMKTKVIRTVCEAREKPEGRSGQKPKKPLTKYVHKMNIEEYLRKKDFIEGFSDGGGDHPCSYCAGFDQKMFPAELKPVKERSWIKRPSRVKKKREVIYTNLSDFMKTDEKQPEVVAVDAQAKKLIAENNDYIKRWNTLLENIAQMEKIVLKTATCTCPDKTKDKSRFDPEMDCTCAVWNIPSLPKSTPQKVSCECAQKIEEVYSEVPMEDKCDCRRKAREKAMEECEKCGDTTKRRECEKEEAGLCQCTKVLDGCGNCVKQTPFRTPFSEKEAKKECDCDHELTGRGEQVTVGYVFVESKFNAAVAEGNNRERCGLNRNFYAAEIENNKRNVANLKNDKVRKKVEMENDQSKGIAKLETKPRGKRGNQMGFTCLVDRVRMKELDCCRREAEKVLNSLKCDCSRCKDLRRKYRAKYVRTGTRIGCGGVIPVVGQVYDSFKECECLQNFEEKVEGIQDYKERLRAKLNLKSKENQYVISGVQQTRKGPIYNLAGVIPQRPCICKTAEGILIEERKKEKLPSKLKTGFKHAISGVKAGKASYEYIIGGATKECECSQVYEKFMKEHNECLVNYERYLTHMRREMQAYMDDANQRYKDSTCCPQKLLEDEIKKMTGSPGLPLPERKHEYLISGVRANTDRKNLILGGVLPNRRKNEERMIAMESYTRIPEKKEDSITKCQRIFLCNYMTFGKNCGNPFQTTKEIEINDCSEEVLCRCISYGSSDSESDEEEQEEEESGCACECPCGVQMKQPEDCSCALPKEDSEESCFCADLEEEVEEEKEEITTAEGCTCGDVAPDNSSTASDLCQCGFKNCGCQVNEVCVKECFYGPMEAWWSDDYLANDQSGKKEVEKETPNQKESGESISYFGGPSRRFVILKKLPKTRKNQLAFIQKLLRGLARDGYPLAMLPDCHKLPYFKLWMQFRMRKKWDYDDAARNYRRCLTLWNHISLCKRKIPKVKVPVRCVCENTTFTWKNAETVSKMVREAKNKFYNEFRQDMVDYAREFYPTLFPYRYPNPSYLNHYFYAYQPGKVENVLAEYVWKGNEHKNPSDYKSCLCK